jgi:hypothetical protein
VKKDLESDVLSNEEAVMAICSKCGVEMQQDAKFCKACGNSRETAGNSDKKARVMAGASKSPKTAIIIGGALALVVAGWLVYSNTLGAKSIDRPMMMKAERDGNRSISYTAVTAENGDVKVQLGTLQGNAASYFAYNAGGKEVKFFVLKATDGTVRVALDACQACYHARLGYRQNGDTLVCNNCGMGFKTTEVGKITGGCSPIPLKNSQDGTTLVVKVKDLEEGVKYF